jgi:transcriptional regulator NrdR family protein
MNTTAIANIAIATLELIEDGLRKIIYTSDRLQEKLELHKLAVINNEHRKAEDKLNKLRLAFYDLERKRILEVNAVNAKAKAARLALDEAERQQVDKLDIAEAVLFEAHDQYVEKAVSRGWVA